MVGSARITKTALRGRAKTERRLSIYQYARLSLLRKKIWKLYELHPQPGTGLLISLQQPTRSYLRGRAGNDVHATITPKSGEPVSGNGCLPRKVQPSGSRSSNALLRYQDSYSLSEEGLRPGMESNSQQENQVSANSAKNSRYHGQCAYTAESQRNDRFAGQCRQIG